MGFLLFCGLGALAGCLATMTLSIVSIVRRERARALAIANLVAIGAVLVVAIGSVLVSLF